MNGGCVLFGTWDDGVLVQRGAEQVRELSGWSVASLIHADGGAALAIVGGKRLCRRAPDGEWTTLIESEVPLSSCLRVRDAIFIGTDTADVLRLVEGRSPELLEGFRRVAGREQWYAGTAVIDGKVVGPPLGVRSMACGPQGELLVNVHVGGIARSTDQGASWHPTIDIEADVHEVSGHAQDGDYIVAAAAVGLCISRDAGRTWSTLTEGLHATYCAAAHFLGDDVLFSAASHHFASDGELYRCANGSVSRVELPEALAGIVDTGCIASAGDLVVCSDQRGNAFRSHDRGVTWVREATACGAVSSVLVLPD